MLNFKLYNVKKIYLGHVETINTNAYVGENQIQLKVIALKKQGIDSDGFVKYIPLEKTEEYYSIKKVTPITSHMKPSEGKGLISKKRMKEIVKKTGYPEVNKNLSKKIA